MCIAPQPRSTSPLETEIVGCQQLMLFCSSRFVSQVAFNQGKFYRRKKELTMISSTRFKIR